MSVINFFKFQPSDADNGGPVFTIVVFDGVPHYYLIGIFKQNVPGSFTDERPRGNHPEGINVVIAIHPVMEWIREQTDLDYFLTMILELPDIL